MYMSFLLPVVEYASVVWDGCSEQEHGRTTLSKRRQQYKLSFMYKVNKGIVPSYIQDLIPPLVSEISNYPLRNNRNISVSFNRTSISQT